MTDNQLHGKKFEDLIKACGLFSGSSDGGRSVIAKFDIEAKFDKQRSLPTSIKSTGSDTVGLSDARRFWQVDEDFRMIVGRYRQSEGVKIFHEIHEFILGTETLSQLRGDMTYADVESLHDGISLKTFPKGKHEDARLWAQLQKGTYTKKACDITLNPKIDSKAQRRFQCSVSLELLIERCSQNQCYTLHTDWIGDIRLPLELKSSTRKFNK